jgi:PEP-CTERM motif-containing protein
LIGFKSASAGRFLKGDLMMKRELFSKLFVLILITALTGSAGAEIMALWNFGPDSSYYSEIISVKHIGVAGFPALLVDGGEKDANGKDGVDYTDTEGNSHNSGQAAAWNDVSISGDNDAAFSIEINTTGWQNMAVRWDYFSDDSGGNRGPTSFDLHYRVNSGSWIELPSWNNIALVRDDAWHEFAVDLAAIADINNKAMVEFLFDDLDEDDDNGEFLVDNIEVTGTVPEPATLILVGLGGMILRRSRR